MLRTRTLTRTISALTLALAGFAWLACGGTAKVDYSNRPALSGLDPVALLEGERTPGNQDHSVSHGDYLYLFADAENKATFEADPEKYRIQGDGSCIVSPGVQADPGIFVVHDEKIFIFATPGCVDQFEADPESFLG